MPTYILDILDRTTPEGKVFKTAHLQGRIVRQIEHLDTDGRSRLRVTRVDSSDVVRTETLDIVDPEDEHYPELITATGVTGTANAIVLAPRYPVTGYTEGDTYLFQAEADSTGSVSIRLSTETQSHPLYFGDDRAGSGDIKDGVWYEVIFAGNRFHVFGLEMAGQPDNDFPVLQNDRKVDPDDVPDLHVLNGIVPHTKGGTAGNSASAARTALGLGTAARASSGQSAGQVPVLTTGGRMRPGDTPEIGTIVSETYTRGTGRRYIGVIPSTGTVTEAIILASLNYEVGQQSLTLPTWTGLQRIFIAQPASRDDLTYISLSGIGNSVSAFTKQSPISVSGTSYDVWLSNEGQEGSSISGLDIQVLPAGVLPLSRGGTGAGYAAMARMGIGAGTSATADIGAVEGEIPVLGANGLAASLLPGAAEVLGAAAKPSSAGTYMPTIDAAGTVTFTPFVKYQTRVAVVHDNLGQVDTTIRSLVRPQNVYPVRLFPRRKRWLSTPDITGVIGQNERYKVVVIEPVPNYHASNNNAPPNLYDFRWRGGAGSFNLGRQSSVNRTEVDGVWYHTSWSNIRTSGGYFTLTTPWWFR